ncbi:hypothetical protein [Microcoleus sp. Pol17_C1]|uniref:hypothetical protein n=1 Tax=unclassified Microcoleus TaxID=2642155 RepID=UPI002FD6B3DF
MIITPRKNDDDYDRTMHSKRYQLRDGSLKPLPANFSSLLVTPLAQFGFRKCYLPDAIALPPKTASVEFTKPMQSIHQLL